MRFPISLKGTSPLIKLFKALPAPCNAAASPPAIRRSKAFPGVVAPNPIAVPPKALNKAGIPTAPAPVDAKAAIGAATRP